MVAVDGRLLGSFVREPRAPDTNPLKTIAMGQQMQAQNRQLDQADRRLDVAAKQAGLGRDGFLADLLLGVIGTTNNAQEAAAYLGIGS